MTDPYNCLGITPDAEDVVIRAAYRALAQRYHPDKWTGDPEFAHRRMAAINEAYSILSNPERRAAYDAKTRKGGHSSTFETQSDPDVDEAFNEALDEQSDKWMIATSIFPDLNAYRTHLAQFSHSLAFSFVTLVLETKKYQDRSTIAASLERHFLERYFGESRQVLDFARKLILAGNRGAALGLNKLVDVMGSEISPELLIARIEEDFGIREARERAEAARREKEHLRHLAQCVELGYFEQAQELPRCSAIGSSRLAADSGTDLRS